MHSLRYKVGSSYFVLVLIGLATSIFAIYNFTRLRDSVGPVLEEAHHGTVAAQNLVRALEKQEIFLLTALVDDWELNRSYHNDARDEFLRWLDQSRGRSWLPSQQQTLDSILILYRSYLQVSDSLFLLLGRQQTRGIAMRYQKFVVRPIVDQLKNGSFRLLESNQASMAHAERIVQETTINATVLVIVASLVSIVLSLIASIQFTRTIIHPAERLTNSVRRIVQGRMDQKIDVTTDDEIGELSTEFNKMTERLHAFEQLNVQQLIAEKNKSEAIVANIADPVIVTDERDRLVLMNQAAAAVLELRGGDWRGRRLRDVLKNVRWSSVLEAGGVSRSEQDHRDPLLSMTRHGSTLYFRPRQVQIADDRGTVQGRVTLLQDVTRFKDLENMKSEFVATVSHELRTPLTSLSMGIDILSKEVLGPVSDRQREILAAAKDDCERLRKLVKDLLDLSRLESGKFEAKKEIVEFRQLVDETIRPLRLPFQEKQIALDIEVHDPLPPILGDAHQLSWVINNLLSNALRFTESGGRVMLDARATPDGLQVSVKDTGRGIPPEAHGAIFEKFVQVKAPTETTPGSVGLGLSIAREVVEAHGGRIWVESAPGAGSTFTFLLPLTKG